MSRIDFSHIPIHECREDMVELNPAEFVIEPMYYKWKFSSDLCMFLRQGTVEKLREAKTSLPKGYNFKIWDAYRPLTVQQALWDDCMNQVRTKHPDWKDEQLFQEARKFIAIPDTTEAAPPPHSTGGTIDLTLVDDNGQDLRMGTTFDQFDLASQPYHFHEKDNLHEDEKEFIRNRSLLFTAMLKVGFRQDIDEWWHFDYGNQLWAHTLKKPQAFYGRWEEGIGLSVL